MVRARTAVLFNLPAARSPPYRRQPRGRWETSAPAPLPCKRAPNGSFPLRSQHPFSSHPYLPLRSCDAAALLDSPPMPARKIRTTRAGKSTTLAAPRRGRLSLTRRRRQRPTSSSGCSRYAPAVIQLPSALASDREQIAGPALQATRPAEHTLSYRLRPRLVILQQAEDGEGEGQDEPPDVSAAAGGGGHSWGGGGQTLGGEGNQSAAVGGTHVSRDLMCIISVST